MMRFVPVLSYRTITIICGRRRVSRHNDGYMFSGYSAGYDSPKREGTSRRGEAEEQARATAAAGHTLATTEQQRDGEDDMPPRTIISDRATQLAR